MSKLAGESMDDAGEVVKGKTRLAAASPVFDARESTSFDASII